MQLEFIKENYNSNLSIFTKNRSGAFINFIEKKQGKNITKALSGWLTMISDISESLKYFQDEKIGYKDSDWEKSKKFLYKLSALEKRLISWSNLQNPMK